MTSCSIVRRQPSVMGRRFIASAAKAWRQVSARLVPGAAGV
jgi:hypothetical protein